MSSSTNGLDKPANHGQPRSLRYRLRTGITFNLIGAAFNQGSTFALNIIVANLLGRDTFGQFTIVQATLAALATLGQVAMGYTATKHVAEFRSRDREKTGRILGLCTTVTVLAAGTVTLALLIGAPWLATEGLRAPELEAGLMIVSGAVFFTVMNGFQLGVLAGLERYPVLARAGLLAGSLYIAICSAMVWLGGLNGAFTGLTVSALVQWGILAYFLRKEIARQGIVLRFRGMWRERHVVTHFGVPASLSSFVTLPALWLASAILARQPGGYDQLALFGAANSFRIAVLFLPQTVNNVGMSVLNNQRGLSESGFRRVFWANIGITALSAAVGAAAVVISGPWLLRIFGRDFEEGYRTLVILTSAAVLEALGIAVFQVVQSRGRIWLSLFAVVLPRDSSIVLLAWLLTASYGAAGLATAHGLAWLMALASIIAVVRHLGLTGEPAASELPAPALLDHHVGRLD